jgi:hypothetical protein
MNASAGLIDTGQSGDADLLVLQDMVKPLLILSPGDVQTWLGKLA